MRVPEKSKHARICTLSFLFSHACTSPTTISESYSTANKCIYKADFRGLSFKEMAVAKRFR